MTRLLPWTLAASFAALTSAGCGDNAACIFAPQGSCSSDSNGGGSGPEGAEAATVPADGQWISDSVPRITEVFPRDFDDAHPDTVVVLEASESLSEASVTSVLANAFDLVEPGPFGNTPVTVETFLVGDGRLVILVPQFALTEGTTYEVRHGAGSSVTDLTGQSLVESAGGLMGSFTVADPATISPGVLATWPADQETDASDLTEIVAIFNQPVDPTTVNPASWLVSVDNVGLPGAAPMVLQGGSGPVTQVFTWLRVGPDGKPQTLGQGGSDVDLVLSPASSPIFTLGMNPSSLSEERVEFNLSTIQVPRVALKHPLSEPPDAIGFADASGTMPVLEIELAQPAQAGDELGVFLFGFTSPSSSTLIALRRTVDVDEVGGMLIAIDGDELELLDDDDEGVLTEGAVSIAVRLQRGSDETPLRLVDVDQASGVQPILFDVVAPMLAGLSTSGSNTSTFVSDMADLVVVGRADEEIRRARVFVPSLGLDNGALPPNVVSSSGGLFISQPVDLGGVVNPADLPLVFDLDIFDRALNMASITTSASFVQVGAVGPGGAFPGRVSVEVFDAETLAPLEGALAMTHQSIGGVVTPVDSDDTDATGFAEPLGSGAGDTIVTVAMENYDLFTFHGLTQKRLHVLLERERSIPATTPRTSGVVVAPPGVDFSPFRNRLGDSRRPGGGVCPAPVDQNASLLFPIDPAFTFNEVVLPWRLGTQSFLSADFTVLQGSFSASGFLRGFQLRAPTAPLSSGGSESGVILSVPGFLSSLASTDQPFPIPGSVLDTTSAGLGASPEVRLTVEARVPGVKAATPVGLGIGFDADMDGDYDVLGAFAGLAHRLLGDVGTLQEFEDGLYLRGELIDASCNRVGDRRQLQGLPGTLQPPDVPSLLSPAPMGASGAVPYDLEVVNLGLDAMGQEGMYRVILTDSMDRQWHLWRPDPGVAVPNVVLHVPDIVDDFGPVGGALANGMILCDVSAFAWPALDPEEFLWSDIERDHQLFAHAAQVFFDQL